MKRYIFVLLVFPTVLFYAKSVCSQDTVIMLAPVEIKSPAFKYSSELRQEAVSADVYSMDFMEANKIEDMKTLANLTPNLFIPDYGSKMTSSIYVRGLGTRVDNAVIGVYFDGVPILNKSCFDFALWDLERIEVLRGVQSCLFGQNTLAGVINVTSLSPMNFQAYRAEAELAFPFAFHTKLSVYEKLNENKALSASVYYRKDEGFFENTYNRKKCDGSEDLGLRLRFVSKTSEKSTWDNTLVIANLDQGGYAYAAYDPVSRRSSPIAYNDTCFYKRFNLLDALRFSSKGAKVNFESNASLQILSDKMCLDQDFTPESMFTLTQKSEEYAMTEEILLSNAEVRPLNWTLGAYGCVKYLDLSAPVLFKKDGIERLILENMNRGIQSMFPNAEMMFAQSEFPIKSDFSYPRYAFSFFGRADYTFGKLKTLLGLRLEMERIDFSYDCSTDLNYRFTLTMNDFEHLSSSLSGKAHQNTIVLLPKLGLIYDLGKGNNLFLALGRGYKSGGFNTQMFSDVMQNQMKQDLMNALGLSLSGNTFAYSVNEIIEYKPERTDNIDLGTHLSFGKADLDLSLFYMLSSDRQITVFPYGQTTGRMMTNAGKSRSYGAEVSFRFNHAGFDLFASYGYTNAKFIEYDDNRQSYKGKYVPYSPQHNLSVVLGYTQILKSKKFDNIRYSLNYTAAGKIYFDNANEISQPLYHVISANIRLKQGIYEYKLWITNLLDCDYLTFYFQSMGNHFVQHSKPLQAGISLTIDL